MLDIQDYLQQNKCKSSRIFYKNKMTSQVHDEFIYLPNHYCLKFIKMKKILFFTLNYQSLMETSHQKYKSFKTPIKVDFGGGSNWGYKPIFFISSFVCNSLTLVFIT